MKRVLTLCLAISATCFAACAQEIPTSDVARILGTLSADSLEGRASLTPGNARAAAFLKSEFAAIGLEPLPGADGYAQNVPITAVTPIAWEVMLNGTAIAPENIFAMSSQESLRADQSGGVTVAYIGPGENVRKRIAALQRADSNFLVILSPEHRKTFERYRRFLHERSLTNEPAEPYSLVAVLADSAPLTSYSVRVRNTVEEKSLENIAGMISGKRPGEIVLFSGHYDHLGVITPVDGDSIANGADDDASGTTAVVALARYYKSLGTPERTLMFVAFAAEEVGGFGSRYFSKQLKPESIVAMCNIEMIGMPSQFGPKSAWITGFDLTSFGSIVEAGAKAGGFAFHPDPYTEQRLFYRSDNATLARLGVPAHSISSSQIDTDPYYHTVNDEFETLDMEHVASVIRGIAQGMRPIVTGEKTPSRVKDGSLK